MKIEKNVMGQVLKRQAGDGPDPELDPFWKSQARVWMKPWPFSKCISQARLWDGLDGALALTHHYRPSIKNFRLKSMVWVMCILMHPNFRDLQEFFSNSIFLGPFNTKSWFETPIKNFRKVRLKSKKCAYIDVRCILTSSL